MNNLIQIGTGFLIVLALVLSNKKEDFASESASIGSMPKNNKNNNTGLPLFLNLCPKFGQDFRLFDVVQKLKINGSNNSPSWNGTYVKGSETRSETESRKLRPIILIPGLGASSLFARWNKTSSGSVQTIDGSGNFQQPNTMSCNQVQNSWVHIWPPNVSGLASFCWADNTRVTVNGNRIVNAVGVDTTTQEIGSIEFANNDYMSTLIDALESLGYEQGINLFAANYDFRKIGDSTEINAWCLSVSKLIEQNCSIQENPAIIIGHDLGAVVANYFLVGAVQEWKDRFIDKFISVSGTFGGCPKALRSVLSGVSAPSDVENFNNVIKTSSGLSLMLPNPLVFGNESIVQLNRVLYSSKDTQKMVETVSTDAAKILKISEKIRDISMNAPGVEVHLLAGTDIDTESSYIYDMSLVNEPEILEHSVGDGTMTNLALEYPIWWSKYQVQPVYFQFFSGVEHTKILSTLEPVQYILNACGDI